MASYKVKEPLQKALETAEALKALMMSLGFEKIEIVGSIRRQEPVVGDIDIVGAGDLMKLRTHDMIEWKRGGPEAATFIFRGQQVNVIRGNPEAWGAAIFYLTGPAQYQVAYRARAKRMGMVLNQHGLWRDGVRIAGATEASIYEGLGKLYKPPHLRGKKT